MLWRSASVWMRIQLTSSPVLYPRITQFAASLRSQLECNRVASVETSIDDAIAAKFRYTKP